MYIGAIVKAAQPKSPLFMRKLLAVVPILGASSIGLLDAQRNKRLQDNEVASLLHPKTLSRIILFESRMRLERPCSWSFWQSFEPLDSKTNLHFLKIVNSRHGLEALRRVRGHAVSRNFLFFTGPPFQSDRPLLRGGQKWRFLRAVSL